jgi:hypothetical protein
MNPVTACLAGAAIALAATSLHYAQELEREQARAQQLAATPALQRRDNSDHEAIITAAAPAPASLQAGAPQDAASTGEGGTPEETPRRDVGSIAIARDRLARLADPQGRAAYTRKLADNARRELTDVAPYIGLSAAEVERIVGAMTDAALPREQRRLECQADPGCDTSTLEASAGTGYWEHFARHLDPAERDRLNSYLDSSDERFAAQQLRDGLPAGALSDEKLERLVQVLAEERRQFVRDAQQAGAKVDQDGAPAHFALLSAAAPGAADETVQRLDSATRYSARQVERASAVLDGATLSRFTESQELALQAYKRRLREKEVAATARRAAGQR